MRKLSLIILICLLIVITSQAQWSGSQYLFGSNGSNPSSPTATFYDQAWVGPTINGLNITFRTGSSGTISERMRIADNGTVAIGTTAPNFNYKLYVNGSTFSNTCVATTMAASQYLSTSDARLKSNVRQDYSSFTKLYDIPTYNYELTKEVSKRKHFGVIAQDLLEIYPNLVHEDENSEYSVNYMEFIPLMIQAIQDQKQLITSLETEIDRLKSKIDENEVSLAPGLRKFLILYPNPTTGELNIDLSSSEMNSNAKIEVVSLNNAILLSQNFNADKSIKLSTQSLGAGVYFVRLVKDGETVESQRIVIE